MARPGEKWRWKHFRRHFIKFLLFLSSERPGRRPSHPSDLPGEPGPWGTLHLCCGQWWVLSHDLYPAWPGSCSAKSLSLSSTLFIKNISVLGKAEASAYLQVNSGTRGFNKGKYYGIRSDILISSAIMWCVLYAMCCVLCKILHSVEINLCNFQFLQHQCSPFLTLLS